MKSKFVLTTLFTFLFYHLSFAQTAYTVIPDPNFEKALSRYDDISEDGKVPTAMIKLVKELHITSAPVKDLSGLEAFEALEVFSCNFTKVRELDVSNNTKLKKLEFVVGKLESIDISNNLDLQELNCNGNMISDLDVSLNSKLKKLSINGNRIKVLDITNNSLLQELDCGDNIIEDLDVSKNTKLINLGVSGNPLGTLNISKNWKLEIVSCVSNQLTTLDISKNKQLRWLACQNNELEILDLSNNPELSNVICSSNNLRSVDATSFGLVSNLERFIATENPSLECIKVNNASAAENKVGQYELWFKDDTTTYSENCNVLSIADFTTNSEIKFYPNPSSGVFHIAGAIMVDTIKIFSTNGSLIRTIDGANSSVKKVDLSGFTKGIYFLQTTHQKKSFFNKVSIQ